MHTPGQPGGKLLILRPRLYKIVPGPSALSANDPRLTAPDAVVIDATPLIKGLPGGGAGGGGGAAAGAAGAAGGVSVFEMDGRLLKLPPSAPAAMRKDQVEALVADALRGQGILAKEEEREWLEKERISHCVKALGPLSVGGLKSLLQKTIRFHAKTVDLSLTDPAAGKAKGEDKCDRPPAAVVAAVTATLLFCEAGTFSPELQLYTRGSTSALKRTAVILIEDAWVEGAEQELLGLMALTLATQRMPEYEPSRDVILATARLAAKAVESPSVIGWRAETKPTAATKREKQQKKKTEKRIAVSDAGGKVLCQAWELLNIVRSFESDIDMFEKVAKAASKTNELRLSQAANGGGGGSGGERMEVMPIYHLVDQHTYRGIGHIGPTLANTFAKRFSMVFNRTTGFNPRIQSTGGFEQQPVVMQTRFAQLCCAKLAFKCPRGRLQQPSGVDTKQPPPDLELKLQLDSGVLAAAVGPIAVKVKGEKGRQREVLVMLGVRCPEDEVVMLKPARATRDLFGSLTDAERASAIAQARNRTLSARSPVLDGTHTVKYEGDCWRLDGEPWETFVGRGRTLKAPIVEAPAWAAAATAAVQAGPDGNEIDASKLMAALKSDEALAEALSVVGEGLVDKAEELIKALVAACADAVALRAVSMMRQQYTQIALPTPSLSGGMGSDQLAAYSGDWDVYRLLALLSRLAPGALRPSMPPNFAVVDANLLRVVERWVLQGMRRQKKTTTTAAAGSAAGASAASAAASSCPAASSIARRSNAWAEHRLWRKMSAAEGRLMEHQRAAVSSMHRRDSEADTGHFLIMDTGVGKTVTSLCYLYRWLVKHGGDVTRRILWVTPAGTVDNLIEQLQNTWSAPVWRVPRVTTAQKPKSGDARRLILHDYHINVIHADHLRVAIDSGLAEQAPYSVICFDEVDEMYAPTLRTSAARRLAQLCPKFVAQTATPMRKNESQLLAWLADTCSFPVDNKNLLVAASGMVSIQLELGIESTEELLLVPMVDEVRQQCRQLANQRAWLPMARMVQSHTDRAMVQRAVAMAQADRAEHRNGGVLLVADTLEHAAKLIQLCRASSSGGGGERFKTGDFDSLEAADASAYGIVVVTKDKDRGYNSACRLGAMVTGAYAGNGASRHQIRGRLRRLGQARKAVQFVTVVMENSILHLLHQRHDAVDSMNISLQQLGDSFSADVLQALDRTNAPAGDGSGGGGGGGGANRGGGQAPAPALKAQGAASAGEAEEERGGREIRGIVNSRQQEMSAAAAAAAAGPDGQTPLRLQYKVRWVGCGKDKDSWVDEDYGGLDESHKRKYTTGRQQGTKANKRPKQQ